MSTSAFAGEGGGSTYAAGVENFLMGAAPPPGFYVLEYATSYNANQLRDNDGKKVNIPLFKLNANVLATRLLHVNKATVLGGNPVVHAILPLVNANLDIPNASESKTGLGDISVGAGIAWHHSAKLHSAAAVDVVVPTGSYNKNNLVNLGRNYWSVQPFYTVSYIDPAGLNADAKVTLNFNQKNKATNYKSGTELIVDYSLGWAVNKSWVVGVGGALSKQINNDTLNNVEIAGSKLQSLSIGPSVKYDNGKGWFITAKWQKEFAVRNKPAGSAFWIKTIIPF